MSLGTSYQQELREQPGTLRRLLQRGGPAAAAIAQQIEKAAPKFGVFAARGSSDNAARYGQYVFGIRHALTVALALPSVVTVYGRHPNLEGSLTIGISQSGQSPDIVSVLREAAEQGALTAAITNDLTSPLAKVAAHTIELYAGPETAVAATKTFTAELMALAMISAALTNTRTPHAELDRVPTYVQETIERNTGVDAHAFRGVQRLIVLARGYNYSAAFETALKLKEISYLAAEPISLPDFFHGPVAMMGDGFPVLLIAPRGECHGDVPRLLVAVKQRGARLIVISDDSAILAQAECGLALPEGMPEWLSPIAAAVAGQLFAGALAASRGIDADSPRGLSKVTLTR